MSALDDSGSNLAVALIAGSGGIRAAIDPSLLRVNVCVPPPGAGEAAVVKPLSCSAASVNVQRWRMSCSVSRRQYVKLRSASKVSSTNRWGVENSADLPSRSSSEIPRALLDIRER